MRAQAPRHPQTHGHINTQEHKHIETDANTCNHICTATDTDADGKKEAITSSYLTLSFIFFQEKERGRDEPSSYPTLSFLSRKGRKDQYLQ